MSYDDDYAKLAARFKAEVARGRRRVLTPRNSAWQARTGLRWWLGYALHEPRDFAYAAPRRLACTLLGQHNPTCIGRRAPHPRTW
ncbi:hypothetical protein [Streptomyces sp. NPDC050263]|uniref:hypothetical protein n=1 Tax=Streptomyces sp. NPDC050263 TaxID=3155037 RepID=UPI003438AB59